VIGMMNEPTVDRSFSTPSRPRASGPIAVLDDQVVPDHYELLLDKLSDADRELERNADAALHGGSLEEASSIVFELLYSLDFKRGGELVPRLAALYGYIGNELLNVARSGDRAQLTHIRDMIRTLRQAAN